MESIREYLSKLGKKGGKARAKNLTRQQRTDAARRAAEARWAKTRKLVDQVTEGAKAPEPRAKERKLGL
jgi:hypothetical protein